jgi:mRNA interferase HigB
MNIVTRKHLMDAAETYPDAARELLAWRKIVLTARWRSFVDVRRVFPDADTVDGFVVFNVRGNRYRLITVIHYSKDTGERITQGHIYIRSFLTHKEYDHKSNWNRGA